MNNKLKDQITSFWQTGVDTLGWLTVISLVVEYFWLHVPDMVMVYTMLPGFAAMIGLPIFELVFPHRCNEDCDKAVCEAE